MNDSPNDQLLTLTIDEVAQVMQSIDHISAALPDNPPPEQRHAVAMGNAGLAGMAMVFADAIRRQHITDDADELT